MTRSFVLGWVDSESVRIGQLLRWLGGFGDCQRCPRTGRGCWRAGWEEHWCWGVPTAMEEAGEHGAGRHGGGTAGCQTDLTNHTSSYVENLIYFYFYEQWKTTTMTDPP
jgi:hypothetical protein